MKPVFHRDDLRRAAGTRSFECGEAYFKAGHVKSLEEYEGAITARVAGTRPYRVKLHLRGRGLASDCTCPFGQEGEFCKHAVAVGLAWLSRSKTGKAAAGRRDEWPTYQDGRFDLPSERGERRLSREFSGLVESIRRVHDEGAKRTGTIRETLSPDFWTPGEILVSHFRSAISPNWQRSWNCWAGCPGEWKLLGFGTGDPVNKFSNFKKFQPLHSKNRSECLILTERLIYLLPSGWEPPN